MHASGANDPKRYYLDMLSMLPVPSDEREPIAVNLCKATYGALYRNLAKQYPDMLSVSPTLPPREYLDGVIDICGVTVFTAELLKVMKATTQAYLTAIAPSLPREAFATFTKTVVTNLITHMEGGGHG